MLIDRIWGPNYFGDTKTLDVHVKRLRTKVEEDPAHPTHIVTVRGVGLPVREAAGHRELTATCGARRAGRQEVVHDVA